MIVGQEGVRKNLEHIFSIFKVSQGKIRPHFILTGSSGTGKTFIVKSLCEEKKIVFFEINAAQITKEGMSGNSLSKCLTGLKQFQDSPVIIFVDEWDKLYLSETSDTNYNSMATLGVQNEFLKVLEAKTTQVFGTYGKYDTIDVSKVLFIFAGAFNNAQGITPKKLKTYGVKTEFLGRVNLLYSTDDLTVQDLVDILKSSQLLRDYVKLFKINNEETVLKYLTEKILSGFEDNIIGARMVNSEIHKYFITEKHHDLPTDIVVNKKLCVEDLL
jgi:ATP-dependent protease Clp ATPase subunit